MEVCGSLDVFNSTNAKVGGGVRRIGMFVLGEFDGMRVCEGSIPHGVFGKQLRSRGHSDEDPL